MTTREQDIRHLEAMFGQGCCYCMEGPRIERRPHPYDTLRYLEKQEPKGKVTGYVEMDLNTGKITTHSYNGKKRK